MIPSVRMGSGNEGKAGGAYSPVSTTANSQILALFCFVKLRLQFIARQAIDGGSVAHAGQ